MISSVANPAIKRVRRLQKRRWRERSGRFLVEGHRAVASGIGAGSVDELFHTPSAERLRAGLLDAARAAGISTREVTPEVMASLTSVATAPDVLGIARLRGATLGALPRPFSGAILLDVPDPATAGSILATVAATGGVAAIFAGSSVDPFEPKVVRAAAGAHFRIAIVGGTTADDAAGAARGAGARVVRLVEKGQPVWTADLGGPLVLIVEPDGAEAGGEESVAVPGDAPGANLAVRAGVVLYEWVRQGGGER